nr:unnamed protein product [Naegleria fowleri]
MHLPQPLMFTSLPNVIPSRHHPLNATTDLIASREEGMHPLFSTSTNPHDHKQDGSNHHLLHHPHSLFAWATSDLTNCCSSNALKETLNSHSSSSSSSQPSSQYSSRSNSPPQVFGNKQSPEEIFESVESMIRSYYVLNPTSQSCMNNSCSSNLDPMWQVTGTLSSKDSHEAPTLKDNSSSSQMSVVDHEGVGQHTTKQQFLSLLNQTMNHLNLSSISSSSLLNNSMTRTPNETSNTINYNKSNEGDSSEEAMYHLIDEVLKDCPSSLGLKWSSNSPQPHQQQQPQQPLVQTQDSSSSSFNMTASTASSDLPVRQQSFSEKISSYVFVTESQTSSPQSSPSLASSTMSFHTNDMPMNGKPKKPRKKASLSKTSSSPCLSSNSNTTGGNDFSNSSPSLCKISKSNKMCGNGSSNSSSNYRVRFGHNMFEEISFKKTNPNSKFIIFK